MSAGDGALPAGWGWGEEAEGGEGRGQPRSAPPPKAGGAEVGLFRGAALRWVGVRRGRSFGAGRPTEGAVCSLALGALTGFLFTQVGTGRAPGAWGAAGPQPGRTKLR